MAASRPGHESGGDAGRGPGTKLAEPVCLDDREQVAAPTVGQEHKKLVHAARERVGLESEDPQLIVGCHHGADVSIGAGGEPPPRIVESGPAGLMSK